jgi:UDP-2,3-diacylglucosamine hydrolase
VTRSIHFISDLHLSPAYPERTDRFLRFLEYARRQKTELYILGDLFDFWTGSSPAKTEDHRPVLEGMREAVRQGVPIHLMTGNRDFLLEERDRPEALAGVRFLSDLCTIPLGKQTALLTHGDLLCSADTAYLRWRAVCRSRLFRTISRLLPAGMARKLGRKARSTSEAAIQAKPKEVLEVTPETAIDLARAWGADLIICGHLHRERMRRLETNGQVLPLYVLGSWEETAPYLAYDGSDLTYRTLP